MRKFLIALLLLLGVFFLLSYFAEINKVVEVLRRGNLLYLGLALLVEFVWIYNLSAFYQSVYRVFGMEDRRLYLMQLVTAAYFVTIVAPSAGLSALAVYVSEAKRRGRSAARVTLAAVLYIWFEYIGTLMVVLLGLGELARRNNLHWPEIMASLVLVAGALGIGLLIYLGMQSARALGHTLAWMARAVNTVVRPFIHHDYLSEARAHSFSAEVAGGLYVLKSNPRWVAWPLLYTLTNKALLMIVLGLCFLAFKVPVQVGTLVAGMGIAHLFLIVSPTPGGIGIVEGILAVALSSLDVPISDATVVTLAYRAFSFWIPFLVGMVTIRWIQRTVKVLPIPQ
jgi:uncharacterized protein (TIRG00374 family)